MSAKSLLAKFDAARDAHGASYGVGGKKKKKRGKKKSTKSGSRRTTTKRRKKTTSHRASPRRTRKTTRRRAAPKRRARKTTRRTRRTTKKRTTRKGGKRRASRSRPRTTRSRRYSRVPRRPSGLGSMRAAPPMLPVYSGEGTWVARDWRGQPRRHKKAGKLGAHRRLGWPKGASSDHSAYAKKGWRKRKASKKRGRKSAAPKRHRKTRRDWSGHHLGHKKAGKLGAHRRRFSRVGGRWPSGFSADHSRYAKKGVRRKRAAKKHARRDPGRRHAATRRRHHGGKGMTYAQALRYFR